jgi:Darcynin, domain of unknown function
MACGHDHIPTGTTRITTEKTTMLKQLFLTTFAAISLPLQAGAAAAEAPQAEVTAQTFTIFMLVKTTPEWLKLMPPARFGFLRSDIEPILAAHPKVKMRFFDSEGYNSRATDVVVWETSDLREYQAVVDKLRESRFWSAYFDIVEIVPSVENAYADAYDERPIGG